MNTRQLSAAVKLAQDNTVRFIDDEGRHLEDITIFDGFGLPDFQPVHCTIRQVAFLIRWQAVMTSCGAIDGNALNEIANVGRTKFIVVGEGSGGAADPGLEDLEALARRAIRFVGRQNYPEREKLALRATAIGFAAYREGRFADIAKAFDTAKNESEACVTA